MIWPTGFNLIYDVAVQSLTALALAEATVEPKSGKLRKGRVKVKLLNDLLWLDGGETKEVTVYARAKRRKGKVGLQAAPAVAPAE